MELKNSVGKYFSRRTFIKFITTLSLTDLFQNFFPIKAYGIIPFGFIRKRTTTPLSSVFRAVKRTGNGSTQTVSHGLNLASNGAAVLSRDRNGISDTVLYDSKRGPTYELLANSRTTAETTQVNGLTSFNVDGYSWGNLSKINTSSSNYIDWTFLISQGFFDVVIYSGDGVNGRVLSHNLNAVPELIICFGRGPSYTPDHWYTYHSYLGINTSLALTSANLVFPWVGGFMTSAPTTSSLYLKANFPSDGVSINVVGRNFVNYLFATKAGVSKVGYYTGSSSGTVTVPCGFSGSANFVLIKRTDAASDWIVVDSTRGSGCYLTLNSTAAEVQTSVITFTNGGFTTAETGSITNASSSAIYVFLAIA